MPYSPRKKRRSECLGYADPRLYAPRMRMPAGTLNSFDAPFTGSICSTIVGRSHPLPLPFAFT